VLGGEYDWPRLPDEQPIRRALDIGANVGAFACWIYKRTGAFIDCYEPHPGAAAVCALNAPPGCVVHEVAVTPREGPTKLYVGSDWSGTSLDPTLNPRSGEVIEVPALHPSKLPHADLIKVSAEGHELEVLTDYPFLSDVAVCLFAWRREKDRPMLEEICRAADLRLFKSTHVAVDVGLQVWVRSRALNKGGRYVMPVP